MIIGSLISEKKVSRLAQTSSYATGLLTARTSQTVIVNFPPVLDPYTTVQWTVSTSYNILPNLKQIY